MNSKTLVLRTNPLFQVLYLTPVFLCVAFVYEQFRFPRPESWFLVLLTLGLAVLTVPRALARVILDDERLVLTIPLRRPRTIFLRQLVGYESSSRMGRTLVLRYHPMDERGRLDVANHEFLGLMPLERQELLEERLRAVVGDGTRQKG